MKTRIVMTLMATIAVVGIYKANVNGNARETVYPMTTMVTDLDKVNDTVTVIDCNGNEWEFSGVEDWMVGDIASLIMLDKGTESIYDDEIITAWYSGTVDDYVMMDLENVERIYE